MNIEYIFTPKNIFYTNIYFRTIFFDWNFIFAQKNYTKIYFRSLFWQNIIFAPKISFYQNLFLRIFLLNY